MRVLQSRRSYTAIVWACTTILLLSACDGLSPVQTMPTESQDRPFKAPTFLPTQADVLAGSLSTVTPTADAACTNDLAFLEDLTIPDGMQLTAGSTIEKQWKVKNNGTCDWGVGYTIQLVSGPDLGSGGSQTLAAVPSGSELVISLYFTVPAETGRYTATWRASDATGKQFGDWFSIEIISASQ